MKSAVILVCFFLLAVCSLTRADDMRSQLPADTGPTTAPANAYRIGFLGNSITRHGTNPDVLKRLKWDHVAGMAASSEDKDFAHTLAAKIQAAMPDRKVAIQFGKLQMAKDGLNLVVIQHGEHEKQVDGAEAMETKYRAMLEAFETAQPRPIIIAVGLWDPYPAPTYGGWAKIVNDTMARVCAEKKIPFISVEKLAKEPDCHGWGEHPGVKWHPNDEGHRRYAEEIFAAWEKIKKP